MESDKDIANQPNTQNPVVDSEKNRDFYIEKSDIESRVVTYIFAIIAAVGMIAMITMGIFAFVL